MSHPIELAGLTRTFAGREAVRDLSLQVPAGSVYALIGPNGAGKTTTIKLLMNLLEPSRGCATVLGVDSRRLGPPELQRIGYVSENQELPGWMTPSELLAYWRPFYGTWDDGLVQRLRATLELEMDAPIRSLSRGTRMKVALLASLAYKPELIILDEPFSGLDPLVREELVRALLERPSASPATLFISSHDVEEVERLADAVAFMVEGRLLLSERIDTLLTRFRLVEVVAANGAPAVPHDEWLPLGVSGRTIRFIDMRHERPDAAARIFAAFPGAHISTSAVTLREIFIALARRRPHAEHAWGS